MKKTIIVAVAASAVVLGGTVTAVVLGTPEQQPAPVAAPPPPPPPTKEDLYVAELERRDIPYSTREKVLKAADLVCDFANSDMPLWVLAKEIDEQVDVLNSTQALAFVSVTKDHYCEK